MSTELQNASKHMSLNNSISKEFLDHITKKMRLNALAHSDAEDGAKAMVHVKDMINAIQPKSPVELMLAAQMLEIFNLQQKMSSYAALAKGPDLAISCASSVIKLSNVFVQQVQLLHRLQGGNSQKVIFEHVHVHDGAQAVIGAVHATSNQGQ